MIDVNIKEEKAVTLTSVIIAIILLIILSAVTFQFVVGPEGIIEKSKHGVSAYKEESIREKVELKMTDWNMELLKNNQTATMENILNLAKNDPEIQDVKQNTNNIILIIDEYQCEINTDLKIVGNILAYNPKTTIQREARTLEFCTIER